ncbi:MAG TPA: foldase protein PrsA [Candidatus Hypogeohydataceae bacterium YC38]
MFKIETAKKGGLFLAILLPLVFLICPAKCYAEAEGTEKLPTPESDVVAAVNGQNITRQELSDLLIESFGDQALDVLIRRVIIYQQAGKQGIKVQPEEVEERLEKLLNDEINALIKARNLKGQDELKEELKKVDVELDDMKERMAARLRKGMEVELLAEKVVEGTVSLTEEDLKEAYEEEYGEKIEASQIVVGTKKAAEEILKKLKAGADFETLARNESIDRLSASVGGRMRPFSPGEKVFGPAAASLEKGGISDMIKTEDGYHILKVIEKRPKGAQKFEDVRPRLEKIVKERTVRKRLGPWLASLIERAKIKKYLATY